MLHAHCEIIKYCMGTRVYILTLKKEILRPVAGSGYVILLNASFSMPILSSVGGGARASVVA